MPDSDGQQWEDAATLLRGERVGAGGGTVAPDGQVRDRHEGFGGLQRSTARCHRLQHSDCDATVETRGRHQSDGLRGTYCGPLGNRYV